MSEYAAYFRPEGLDGIVALHARFVRHTYRPHSHPTWTVAVVERGAARFTVDASDQRAGSGELFVLEPEAVHTGMAAVPEGWQYKVLYVEPELVPLWDEHDAPGPRAARWTVFRDRILRGALLDAHRALAAEPPGLAVDEAVLRAVDGLRPHLRPRPPQPRGGQAGHAAVRRAVAHLKERWNERVPLIELAAVAGLSRFELVRRFGAQTGLTPHAFQTNLRITHARGLLATGNAPAAVAAICGFADQAHLTRTFRVAGGLTPARYARAVTG
ncbi:MAG: AraC family ligand binding domain-containing protein [Solirubrobacteraceae bacterium]